MEPLPWDGILGRNRGNVMSNFVESFRCHDASDESMYMSTIEEGLRESMDVGWGYKMLL